MKLLLLLFPVMLTGQLLCARPATDSPLAELQAHEPALTYRITEQTGDYEEHRFQFYEDRVLENVVRHHAQTGFNQFKNYRYCFRLYAEDKEDCPLVLKQHFSLPDCIETTDSVRKIHFIGIPCTSDGAVLQWAFHVGDSARENIIRQTIQRLHRYLSEDYREKDNAPSNIFQAYKTVALMLNNASCPQQPGLGHFIRAERKSYSLMNLEEQNGDGNRQSFRFDMRKIVAVYSQAEENGCTTASERLFLRLEDSIPVITETKKTAVKKSYTKTVSFVADRNVQLIKSLLNDIARDNNIRRTRIRKLKDEETY